MRLYEIRKLAKFAEKDNWENGCDPSTSTGADIDVEFFAKTPEEVILKMFDFVGASDHADILVNSCDEVGRVDIQVMETGEGIPADDAEIKEWKAGRLELWLACYSGRVTLTERQDVDLKDISIKGVSKS